MIKLPGKNKKKKKELHEEQKIKLFVTELQTTISDLKTLKKV